MVKDLFVLVADVDMVATVKGLLGKRCESLGIRPIDFDVERHIGRDSGCRIGAAERLRGYRDGYRYALVMFDKDGSGKELETREAIQNEVEGSLRDSGWLDRSKVIVIEPELEAWVWNGSPHTPRVLGSPREYEELQTWLRRRDLWPNGLFKPPDPKQAMLRVLKANRVQRSPDLYRRMSSAVSLRRCRDPAFLELRATLRQWFPLAA